MHPRGCSERVDVLAGDMLAAPLLTGFDAHLWLNVLHDWDDAALGALLAKSSAALPSGGLLIIHEAYINADKPGPLHIAEYSALLMNITEGKCYSLSEYRTYLNESGFE